MKYFILFLVAILPSFVFGSDSHQKEHSSHWSYAGESGPGHWSKLNADFHACSDGHQQSPVDLKWTKAKGSRILDFHYNAAPVTVVDNGHTIQVNIAPGSYAVIDGKRYELAQFHFHALSEHTFSGKHFPLEAHFVHKDKNGKLAVVGVMFQSGKHNEELSKIFSHIPKTPETEKKIDIAFNPAVLMPKTKTHYQYSGSLTTPPCSEGVNWTVLNSPMEISSEQIGVFNNYYSSNYRPIQTLHERKPANFY